MAKQRKVETTWNSLLMRVKKNANSFMLGIAAVVVIALLIFRFAPLSPTKQAKAQPTPTIGAVATQSAQVVKEKSAMQPDNGKAKTYTVQNGDSLWTIAEKMYGSGYNAYDIASANKLENASVIDVGQTLVIPSISPKTPTQGEITPVAASAEKGGTITQSQPTTYTVAHGDYLWKIAVEMYGDGYEWVRIARANNLAHPGLIHTGNVLTIPRP